MMGDRGEDVAHTIIFRGVVNFFWFYLKDCAQIEGNERWIDIVTRLISISQNVAIAQLQSHS